MFNEAQIAEALNTVLEINSDDTPRITFFGFAGHVKALEIDVYPNGLDPNDYSRFICYADNSIYEKTIYYGKNKFLKIPFRSFDEMLEDIRKVGT